MLSVVNDNKLGSHVVRISVPYTPKPISYPPPQKLFFRDRHDYVPNFHEVKLAYNPGEKSKQSNSWTNNYQKTIYKTSTQESAINSWVRL